MVECKVMNLGKVRFVGTNKAIVTINGKEYEVSLTFERRKVSEIEFGHPLPTRTVTPLQVKILYALKDEIEKWL